MAGLKLRVDFLKRWHYVISALVALIVLLTLLQSSPWPSCTISPKTGGVPLLLGVHRLHVARSGQKAELVPAKLRNAEVESLWEVDRQTAASDALEPFLAPPGSVIPALYATEEYYDLRRNHSVPFYTVTKPIPVVGIPVLNRGDWLKRLVYSIDVPVNRVHIVFNTMPGSPMEKEDETDVQAAIDELQARIGAQWIVVTKPGCNLGCAGAWNTVIEKNPNAPYWLITNADVAFGPGALARVPVELDNPKFKDLEGFFYSAFRFFVIRRSLVQKIGVFDENYWPAYSEDTDYRRRLVGSGLGFAWTGAQLPNDREFLELDHIHGNHEVHGEGKVWLREDAPTESGAIRQHEAYKDRLRHSSHSVVTYAAKKWGPESLGTSWVWKYPFNNSERGMHTWLFNEKVRSWQESIWNFDNSPELLSLEDYSGWAILPGDQTAEHHGWMKTGAFVPAGYTRDDLPKRLCASGFAKHNGQTEWLLGPVDGVTSV